MSGIYTFDDFELDLDKLELTRAGKRIHVNTLTLRLLEIFVQSPGQIISKQQLLERVWGGRVLSDNVLTVAMARLRTSLGCRGAERDIVVSVHGRGYRFGREVVRRGASASHAAPPSAAGSDVFVGRERVLDQLRSLLLDAESGSGGLVMLSGEAGIGKTRVAEVFSREAAARGFPVAWGYCREVGDTPPLWPFIELVREVIERTRVSLSEPRLRAHLAPLVRLLPELAGAFEPAPTEESAVVSGKHRIFDAIARLLGLAAETRACVLLLDDLHRGDPTSLELINYLIDEIPRTRLLVISTIRHPSGQPTGTLARVLGHRNTTRIALPRLSEEHVGRYLDAVLGSATLTVRHAVFATSEGIPFFMTELTRQLRLNESSRSDAIALPDAALDVVRQRLAALDGGAREALSAAAVIGRSFTLAVLRAVTGCDAHTLMKSLDVAIASAVLQSKGDSHSEFQFAHELLRAVLYDALPPGERRDYHLRVATALEQRIAQGDVVAPSDLAFHARSALPAGDARKTVRHCIDAANAATHVFAYADAARCLDYALEALELVDNPSPRMRIGLLLHQALVTRPISTRTFKPLIARVVQLALEQNQADALARAAMLYDAHLGMPAFPGSVGALQAARTLLERQGGEPALLAAMLGMLAISPPLAFSAAGSGAHMQRAMDLAGRSGDILDRFCAAVTRLYLTGGPLSRELSRRYLRELHEMCRANPVVLSVPPVMLELHCALTSLQEGDLSGMRAALDRGTARSRDLDSELLWQFERFGALARYNAGERADARRALKELYERAHKQAISETELFRAHDAAVLFGATLEQDAPLQAALAPSVDDRPCVWSLKLRALHACGLSEDARRALAQVTPAGLAQLPCDRDYLGTLGALARVACEQKALDYAEALYALLEPYPAHFAVHVSFVCEGSVSQLLGMLAHTLGHRERALEHLRAAVAHSERVGMHGCAQDARRELARCRG